MLDAGLLQKFAYNHYVGSKITYLLIYSDEKRDSSNIKATDIQSRLINSINQQNIWIKLRVSGMPTNPVLQRHLSM